jgi:hypothetical protein
MTMLNYLLAYLRFGQGLRGFLGHRITLEEARKIVKRRLAEREETFLRVVERGIFGYPRSPYLPLLRGAGCELGDIQKMVRADGVEGTLRSLREEGVYVTFEEFKGIKPIVRNGQTLAVRNRDFDNPNLAHYYQTETGGTTGAPIRVVIDLDHLADQAPLVMLGYDALGLLHVPMAMWCTALPGHVATNIILHGARIGYTPQKWFTPITQEDVTPPLKYRLATEYILLASRLLGLRIPRPEPVSLEDAALVARWAAKTLENHGACVVRAHVSMAVRVSIAAQEEGLDLTGATLVGGGEPPTVAKVQQITRCGARWASNYFSAEAGAIGWGCARPVDGSDTHFFRDRLALVQYPRQVPDTDITVNAFYFTTLLPSVPKLMLNVESDDYGILEERACGCPLESCGFTHHLRDVHSFRKLTGEGMTMVGSQVVRILEHVLPTRFGGSPLDYQLLEEEDEQGLTRLYLLINPEIGGIDEDAVVQTVLETLGQSHPAADMAQALWRQAGTLRVRRAKPIWTARGKLMPLHLGRRSPGTAE